MKGSEVFALTPLPRGVSLAVSPYRRPLYRIERLRNPRTALTLVLIRASVASAARGGGRMSCKARAANGSGGSGTSTPTALQGTKRGEDV